MTELYCLHVLGMDDVHPAPDRKTAQLWATQWTLFWHDQHPDPHPFDPIVSYVVAPWPWDDESHAAGLAQSIADNTFPDGNRVVQFLATAPEKLT